MDLNIIIKDNGFVSINSEEYVKVSLTTITKPEDNHNTFEGLDKLLNIVKSFEGFFPQAYLCPAKVWTIGWGTTIYQNGKKVQSGDTITRDEAQKELLYELQDNMNFVKKHIKGINEDQFQALVSFVYNCGSGSLQNTQIRKALDEKRFSDVPNQMMRWINAKGKPLMGLWRRRASEALMFQGYKDYIVNKDMMPSNWANMRYFDPQYSNLTYKNVA